MEAQTTLVRTERRVELHTVSTVDAKLAGIVLPGDTELDNTLGNGADLEGGTVLWVLLEEGAVLEGAGELCSSYATSQLDCHKLWHEVRIMQQGC